jgi:hypothetical protein
MLYVEKKNNKEKRIQTGEFEGNILCAKCDNEIIGLYELYASQIINSKSRVSGINVNIYKNKYGVEQYAKLIGVDYTKFKLFLLSILWRASISKRDFFKETKLNLEDEERLREMIFNKNPGNPDDFPCTISIAKNQRLLRYMIRQPLAVNNGCQFMIGGTFYFFQFKRPFPNFVTKSTLQKNGEMIILFMSDDWVRKFEQQIVDNFSRDS